MKYRAVNGTYGSGHTPCTVLVAQDHRGGAWYCVEGSANVNYTPFEDDLADGVDVETLEDTDCFTWPEGVHDLDGLEAAIEA